MTIEEKLQLTIYEAEDSVIISFTAASYNIRQSFSSIVILITFILDYFVHFLFYQRNSLQFLQYLHVKLYNLL